MGGIIKRVVLLAAVFAPVSPATAGQAEFRWLTQTADAAVFKEVRTAFSDELASDLVRPTEPSVPLTVKYIERIGLFDDTALVIVGYKTNRDDPYPEFRGFTFRLGSHAKSLIHGTRELSDWLPMWQFRTIAHFEDNRLPDIVFRYLSCTECEATELLASVRYDARSRAWTLQHWSKEDGDALLIGRDDEHGDEATVSYECLQTVRDLTRDGLDDVAIRCRETLNSGKTKGVTNDETVLYTLRKGVFGRTVLHGSGPMNASIQAALCESTAKSPLCKKR